MSSTILTAFSLYKRTHEDAYIVAGGSRAAVNPETGRTEITIGNVPFDSRTFSLGACKLPNAGVLLLTGIRDKVEALSRWRAHAREIGCDFASADIEVEVGSIHNSLVNKTHLLDGTPCGIHPIKMIRMDRLRSEYRDELAATFLKLAEKHRLPVDPESPSDIWRFATYPGLYDELLILQKELVWVDVLILPVADSAGDRRKLRQLAYLRPGSEVLSIRQHSDDADLVFSKGFVRSDVKGVCCATL